MRNNGLQAARNRLQVTRVLAMLAALRTDAGRACGCLPGSLNRSNRPCQACRAAYVLGLAVRVRVDSGRGG